MTPYFEDSHSTLYNGDSRHVMAGMEPESVDCCVTSPPYWSLRAYAGIEPLLFGGREDCEHEFMDSILIPARLPGTDNKNNTGATMPSSESATCRLCSAWRGHYGLEPTPSMYIEHSMEYLDAIWRVLKTSGTVFWNLGDSWVAGTNVAQKASKTGTVGRWHSDVGGGGQRTKGGPGLKPKDMALIPFRFAIAAQERGWWVRSVIIWAKNNPMPESVTDRPTAAHEYIFLLTKSGKYYWNQDAIMEKAAYDGRHDTQMKGSPKYANGFAPVDSLQSLAVQGHERWPSRTEDGERGRNSRSVWTFPTQGYPEAHFATFPEELPRRCIAAGTSEKGVCSDCGAPWEQVVERTAMVIRRSERTHEMGRTRSSGTMLEPPTSTPLCWRPTCKHTAEPIPAVVLDLFAGSGTTLHVARKMGRRSIGVELSSEYCDLIVDRIRQGVLL